MWLKIGAAIADTDQIVARYQRHYAIASAGYHTRVCTKMVLLEFKLRGSA